MTKKRSKLLALAVLMILTLAVLVSCAAGQQAKETGSAVGETGAANHGETAKTGETPAPTITITAPEKFVARIGETVDLLQDVVASDPFGNRYPVTVKGSYDLTKTGEYRLQYEATADGKTVAKEFVLSVLASPFAADGSLIDGEYVTDKGFPLVIRDGTAYVDGFVLVNKSYPCSKTFGDGLYLTPETESAYTKMKAALLSETGLKLTIKSAHRSYNDQRIIFNGYVARDGMEEAMTYSARPGFSEHQTAMAMDLICSDFDSAKDPTNEKILNWLDQNAYKYGFIKRYTEAGQSETGYVFEPWHYRYVGTELAEKLYNGGNWITMEAYFGVDSYYHDIAS